MTPAGRYVVRPYQTKALKVAVVEADDAKFALGPMKDILD
jgi:hypothetical protein